jgi:heat shock protein HslJ
MNNQLKRIRMTTSLFLISIPILAVTLAACSAGGQSQSLDGTNWVLESLRRESALSVTTITAGFQGNGRMSGSTGCNKYNAANTTDGDMITISPGATTLMACPTPIMIQESAFLDVLASATTYKIEGDEMELKDASGDVIAKFSALEPVSLTVSSWQVIGYNNGKLAVVSVIIGTEITANFGEDGTLSGSAGCNNYNATYEVDGDNISIGPAAATRMFCPEPDGVMEQEVQYLAALETVATYLIEVDKMEMRTAEGALAATFQAAGE